MAKLCFVVEVVAGPLAGGGVPPPTAVLLALPLLLPELVADVDPDELDFELDFELLEPVPESSGPLAAVEPQP